jgi:succinylglutamate desuccinylase
LVMIYRGGRIAHLVRRLGQANLEAEVLEHNPKHTFLVWKLYT